jgi:hypothetical protein
VLGPAPRSIRIGDGYAEVRRRLRTRWSGRPLQSDWGSGRFPPAPFGGPVVPVVAAGVVGLVALVVAVGWAASAAPAAVIAAFGAWRIARWLDGVQITRRGIQVGPPWSLVVPWHDVQVVGVVRVGRETRIWMRGTRGASSGSIPAVLLPAVRARIRRQGGLRLDPSDGGLDQRYAQWRAAAAGIPWGVGLGTLVAAPLFGDPWAVIGAGGVGTLALALFGAAVEARATGWGTGAIGWLTVLYGLVLSLVGIGRWL